MFDADLSRVLSPEVNSKKGEDEEYRDPQKAHGFPPQQRIRFLSLRREKTRSSKCFSAVFPPASAEREYHIRPILLRRAEPVRSFRSHGTQLYKRATSELFSASETGGIEGFG